MSKAQSGKTNPSSKNVIQLPSSCPVENCNNKPRRAGFCEDHFIWFKEGLINRKGEKPKDFDKKMQAYLNRNRQAA